MEDYDGRVGGSGFEDVMGDKDRTRRGSLEPPPKMPNG